MATFLCVVMGVVKDLIPIAGFISFVLAGFILTPAFVTFIIGHVLKDNKTEKETPWGFRLYNWGLLGLKAVVALIILALVGFVINLVVPIVLSNFGVTSESCLQV